MWAAVRIGAGVFSLWYALFGIQQSETEIVNWVHERWLKLLPVAQRADGAHTSGTAVLVRSYDRLISWLYGKRVWSIGGVWTAFMVSVASVPAWLVLAAFYFFPRAYREYRLQVGGATIALFMIAVVATLLLSIAACFGSAAVVRKPTPTLTRWKVRDLFEVLACALIAGTTLRIIGQIVFAASEAHPEFRHVRSGVALMIGFSILENMLSMSILRRAALYWQKTRESDERIKRILGGVVVIAAAVASCAVLFYGPFEVARIGFLKEQRNMVGFKRVALVLSVMTNVIEMLLVSVIGVGVFILVVHSMLWETVLRYSERFEV
jgi:hypothetical protein